MKNLLNYLCIPLKPFFSGKGYKPVAAFRRQQARKNACNLCIFNYPQRCDECLYIHYRIKGRTLWDCTPTKGLPLSQICKIALKRKLTPYVQPEPELSFVNHDISVIHFKPPHPKVTASSIRLPVHEHTIFMKMLRSVVRDKCTLFAFSSTANQTSSADKSQKELATPASPRVPKYESILSRILKVEFSPSSLKNEADKILMPPHNVPCSRRHHANPVNRRIIRTKFTRDVAELLDAYSRLPPDARGVAKHAVTNMEKIINGY
jgi:hypothetical protein